MNEEFQFTHSTYGVFKDVIYIPDGFGLSDEDIEDIKVQRYNSWVNQISIAQCMDENLEPINVPADPPADDIPSMPISPEE